jgi:hypothetical protein
MTETWLVVPEGKQARTPIKSAVNEEKINSGNVKTGYNAERIKGVC